MNENYSVYVKYLNVMWCFYVLYSLKYSLFRTRTRTKLEGEKIYSLQRMRALERSWLGWRLRTIKMIHLSKIKVSRTSRMLKFELFWLFLCIHWTVSKGCVLQDYQLSDIYKSWSVSSHTRLIGFTCCHSILHWLLPGWPVCPIPRCWDPPDWDNQFLNRHQPEPQHHSLPCLSSPDYQSQNNHNIIKTNFIFRIYVYIVNDGVIFERVS